MRFFLSGVMVALLGLGVVRGQDSAAGRITGSPPPLSKDPTPVLANPPGPGAPGGPTDATPIQTAPSPWMIYPREPGCTGPMGCDGPIGGEIYFRSGVSTPISGNFFGRLMDAGWQIDGGGRSIFYNKERNKAWVIDLGITTIFNDAKQIDVPVVLSNIKTNTAGIVVPLEPIAVKHMNRTYVNVGGGKEWYFWGPSDCQELHVAGWRMGVDAGGRYGTMKVDINKLQLDLAQLRHLTDTIAGMYCAWHTDLIIPFGPGLFTAGFRAEWGYTWTDVLQFAHSGDLMDVNLLGTVGFQF
jgi:hypothetical protein